MQANISSENVLSESCSKADPLIDKWLLLRDKNGAWMLDVPATDALDSELVCSQRIYDVIGHFNLDKLPVDQQGVTLFDEPSGQTYRLIRSSMEKIEVSQTTTTRYLQQYLAEREALFFQSQKISVGEMATTLAHEINQPIGAIQNLLQGMDVRLRKQIPDIDELRQAVGRSIDQTQFASRIVSRIRDFTQARKPSYQILSVQSLLEESLRLLDWVFSTRGIKLEIECTPDLKVRGDFTMLQQVVTNLLRNAIEAIEVSERSQIGVICVSSRLEEDKVQIKIRDNGVGLQDPQQLFTPFATSKPEGMGVGLNICRSFIELHNGRLWLSPADVVGSICVIQLPRSGDNNAK